MFSKRSGTKAYLMDNQIDEDTKKDRIHKLLALTKTITKEKNIELVNKTIDVISIKDTLEGYECMTDSGKTLFVSDKLEPNKFYSVKITKFANNKLFAELLREKWWE